MAKFDSEDLLDSILQIMTDGLNTKIAAIEAEKVAKGKGLTPTLAQIPSGGYILQTWNEKALNINPAIFYGIEDVTAQDSGANVVAKTYKIFVEIVLTDSGMTNDGSRRIARYTRALEEVFKEAFDSVAHISRIKVETVRPVSFRLDTDSSVEVKVGGVSLTMSLA